jgi:hypothetical protein
VTLPTSPYCAHDPHALATPTTHSTRTMQAELNRNANSFTYAVGLGCSLDTDAHTHSLTKSNMCASQD